VKILGTFLKGSQNYGLALPESDEDWITIVTPSLAEFYYNYKFSKQNTEHETYWTLRQFVEYFLKGNPTAIEIVYSSNYEIYDGDFEQLVLDMRRLLSDSDFLLSIWTQFSNAICGLTRQEIGKIRQEAELVRRVKHAVRARYFIALLMTIATNDFHVSSTTFTIPTDTDPSLLWLRQHPEDWREDGEFGADFLSVLLKQTEVNCLELAVARIGTINPPRDNFSFVAFNITRKYI